MVFETPTMAPGTPHSIAEAPITGQKIHHMVPQAQHISPGPLKWY